MDKTYESLKKRNFNCRWGKKIVDVSQSEYEAELKGAPIKPVNKIASVYSAIIKKSNRACVEDIAFLIEWINDKLKHTPTYIKFSHKKGGKELYIESLEREIRRIKNKKKNIIHINRVKRLTFPENKLNPFPHALYFKKNSFLFYPPQAAKGKDIYEDAYSVELIHFPTGVVYTFGDYLEGIEQESSVDL